MNITFNQAILHVPYVKLVFAMWKPTAISPKAIRAIVTMFKPISAPQAGGKCPHRFHFHTLMIDNYPYTIATPMLVRLETINLHQPYCIRVVLIAQLAYFVLPWGPILIDINTILGHLGL